MLNFPIDFFLKIGAGWNITMFNSGNFLSSIRGPHFPASYVSLPEWTCFYPGSPKSKICQLLVGTRSLNMNHPKDDSPLCLGRPDFQGLCFRLESLFLEDFLDTPIHGAIKETFNVDTKIPLEVGPSCCRFAFFSISTPCRKRTRMFSKKGRTFNRKYI